MTAKKKKKRTEKWINFDYTGCFPNKMTAALMCSLLDSLLSFEDKNRKWNLVVDTLDGVRSLSWPTSAQFLFYLSAYQFFVF